MIFETELDDAGNSSIKQLPYSSEPCNAIKRDLFPRLSPSQEKDLSIINHFFKQNLYSNLLNYDKKLEIIKNEEFDAVDFKSLFGGLFNPVFDLFKDIFFINEKGELINRYEGYVLKIDAQTQKIHFEKLPGYEILWEQTEEKLKNSLSSNEIFNLEEYINVRHLNILGIDIKKQFLAYTGEFFKTDKYPIELPLVAEKMFNYLNKDGYLKNIDNFNDFKKEFLFIKERYYDNRYFTAAHIEYVLDGKDFSSLNDCNLFDFFDKRMSDLFYDKEETFSLITHNNECLRISDVKMLQIPSVNEVIDPEYVDELNKVINIYTPIQYRLAGENAVYSNSFNRKYLYSENRTFYEKISYHRICNLNYTDFLNHYKMNDDTMSLCFYHYMFEFSLIDKKIDDYINEMIIDFTHNHEKARVLLSGESNAITVTDFNKNVELPLHILNNLFNENKEEENLFKVFFSIYEGKVPVEYNNTHEDMKKLFSYASAHNKNNFLCEELEKLGYFESSVNIINFIGCVKDLFEDKGEFLSSKVDLDGCVSRRLKKELDSLEELKNRMRWINNRKNDKKERNMDDDEWVNFIDEKLFKLLTGDGLISSEEEIISNFIWVEKEFESYSSKVVCSLRRTACFNEEKNWRSVGMSFQEIIQVIDLLDYHLLKGHNQVVYYLKSKDFYPRKKEDGLTPLDYALIGACDNDILDWVCEQIEVKPLDKMNVFGFLRVPLFPININNKMIYETLLNEFETKSFFNSYILNDKNPDMKLDSAVLEKMSYVYKKYKVNFNNNSERIYHLLNKENCSFFRNDLNLNSNSIEQIKYSLLIKDLVSNREIDLLNEEIKTSRLTIDMNLMHNVIIKDNKESSGILNLLYLTFKYSNKQKDIDFIYDLVTSLLDNMNNETKKNLHNIRDFEGLNIFEVILSLGVHEHRKIIKKLVIDYDFDLKSGVFVFNKLTKEEDFKTYKELYFSRDIYLENLYIYFSTQFEKEKIGKVINSVEIKKMDRKRM